MVQVQVANQSTIQATNQWTNQANDLPTNRLIDQPINLTYLQSKGVVLHKALDISCSVKPTTPAYETRGWDCRTALYKL